MGISSIMSPERPVCNVLLFFLHPYTERSGYVGMVLDGSSKWLGLRTPGSVTSSGTHSVFCLEQVPEAAQLICAVCRPRAALIQALQRVLSVGEGPGSVLAQHPCSPEGRSRHTACLQNPEGFDTHPEDSGLLKYILVISSVLV